MIFINMQNTVVFEIKYTVPVNRRSEVRNTIIQRVKRSEYDQVINGFTDFMPCNWWLFESINFLESDFCEKTNNNERRLHTSRVVNACKLLTFQKNIFWKDLKNNTVHINLDLDYENEIINVVNVLIDNEELTGKVPNTETGSVIVEFLPEYEPKELKSITLSDLSYFDTDDIKTKYNLDFDLGNKKTLSKRERKKEKEKQERNNKKSLEIKAKLNDTQKKIYDKYIEAQSRRKEILSENKLISERNKRINEESLNKAKLIKEHNDRVIKLKKDEEKKRKNLMFEYEQAQMNSFKLIECELKSLFQYCQSKEDIQEIEFDIREAKKKILEKIREFNEKLLH